jgi:aminoglycoside phosphotransferase (APT) family kinase protein
VPTPVWRLPEAPGRAANRTELSARTIKLLAPDLGRFLSWLQALPIDDAFALGVADQRHIDALGEARHEAVEELPLVRRVLPDAPIDEWRTFLEGSRPRPQPPAFALVHNDLAAEHVLVDETVSTVTGVIDWSDVAVGDRAIDIGGIFHWGGAALLDAVLAHYTGEIGEGLLARARFFAAARGVQDVPFGLDRNDQSYIENGVRAIRWAID